LNSFFVFIYYFFLVTLCSTPLSHDAYATQLSSSTGSSASHFQSWRDCVEIHPWSCCGMQIPTMASAY